MLGPDAGQQLRHAEAGDTVARVLRPAQHGEHVLDVRGLEELQPAELHERNVAPGQLDFERRAVMEARNSTACCFSAMPASRLLQDLLDDVAGLRGVVGDVDEGRALGRGAIGPQVLGEAFGGEFDHRVGRGQDRLRRTIVAARA